MPHRSTAPTLSAAFSLALGLTLAACGEAISTTGASPAAAPKTVAAKASTKSAPLPRACGLVSDAEAQTLLGLQVAKMDDSPENCLWSAASNVPGRFTMLMVQPMQMESVSEAESTFEVLVEGLDALNKSLNDATKRRTRKQGVTIEGVGDSAWRSGGNVDLIGTNRLVARKGARILVINITGGVKPDGLGERMEALAKTAIVKL
jgi:hypothetical protein